MTSAVRSLHFDELDSTNAHAARLAKDGQTGPLWITADRQTAGRGRQDRRWLSQTGNLFTTCLITLAIKPAIAAQLSFVTSLAVYETAAKFIADTGDLALKWPNDVLLGGKKLAGILIETVGDQQSDQITLAIGCGINIAHAPDNTSYGAACLHDYTTTELSPNIVATTFHSRFDHWLALWNNGKYFDQIIIAWQQRAAFLGQSVSIVNGRHSETGRFAGLAPDGALILTLANGTNKTFYAGDISLRPSRN